MTQLILRIYDALQRRHWLMWTILGAITVALLILISRLRFQEDISAFLPLSSHYEQLMADYQHTNGAGRVIVITQMADSTKDDPDRLVEATDRFAELLEKADTGHWTFDRQAQVDLTQAEALMDYTYAHLPLYLTAADYQRMDSLLAQPGYVAQQMAHNRQSLMMLGSMEATRISHDPLGLFTPVLARLQGAIPTISYELYDDHIFSADMRRAYMMMRSAFGSNETEKNRQMLTMLTQVKEQTEHDIPGVNIRLTGAPVIAVGNATQIKTDSLIAVAIAVVLILLLLFTTLRSWRNILLIALSIGWGWLVAMGGLSLVHQEVSIIIIGIASVIIGIAVNYPLHLVVQGNGAPTVRQALREIVAPLVVGNVTTVGAFMALIPLQSVAMRDLGIFASLLLLGTITFVIVFMPHMVKPQQERPAPRWLAWMADVNLTSHAWVMPVVLVLTLVLGWFSRGTSFDSNLQHINYMADDQRQDMAMIDQYMKGQKTTTVFAVHSGRTLDAALRGTHGAGMLVDLQTQRERLARWTAFVSQHGTALKAAVAQEGTKAGFAQDSFDPFRELLDTPYTTVAPEQMLADTHGVSERHVRRHAEGYDVILSVNVRPQDADATIARLERLGLDTFTSATLNAEITNNLSKDFDYIGWACSLVVFFFLWASMRSLKLAIISFLPMAVSWLWILGLMDIGGMHFNVVNVILATFIFGQGDDYTIFVTEGCIYEYRKGRRVLSSYKQSIIISAMVMFIGIGSLVIARHPALHSLGEVTIVGMFSVVLMAWLIPPYIFRWLMRHDRRFRANIEARNIE